MATQEAEGLVERIERLSQEAGPEAQELLGAVMELYGEGLERIVEIVQEGGEAATPVRDRMIADGVVASLLLIHDLYPVPLSERVADALASVRPYMESHGGDVELLGVEEGVAKMRLVGHCEGCPASEATLELAIKKALEETAPDLEGLEVEGVEKPAFELPVVQSNGAAPAWTDLDGDPPAVGRTAPMTVGGADVLVANVGGTLLAYRNTCGWCRARLDAAPMAPDGTLTCPACERRFELRRAGRSPDDDRVQIPPVPLLRGEGRVRVAVA
jgi:Fe-S cluster biogenesis protein NfuA